MDLQIHSRLEIQMAGQHRYGEAAIRYFKLS